jgi:hypothetical protein
MPDLQILQMALIGYQAELQKIESAMATLRSELKGAAAPMVTQGPTAAKKFKRTMSAAARKRIADAQKLRWAKFHEAAKKPAAAAKKATVKKTAPKAAAKKAAPKRKLSAAAKAKLVANLAKARAAKAAKKTEGEAVPF